LAGLTISIGLREVSSSTKKEEKQRTIELNLPSPSLRLFEKIREMSFVVAYVGERRDIPRRNERVERRQGRLRNAEPKGRPYVEYMCARVCACVYVGERGAVAYASVPRAAKIASSERTTGMLAGGGLA